MSSNTRFFFTLGSVLLLSSTLVSCKSTAGEPISAPSINTSSINTPAILTTNEQLAPDEPGVVEPPITAQPTDSPEVTQVTPTAPEPSSDQPAASEPPVEASTMEPEATKQVLPPKISFQLESPTLGGLTLGSNESDVFDQYGLPLDTYPLPGDSQTVNIWQYDGFSVGLNAKNKVVYVEISSAEVSTGIRDLSIGMDDTKAAKVLGIPMDGQTNVLTLEVTGGWVKLDLDPEAHIVLSIKLINEDV